MSNFFPVLSELVRSKHLKFVDASVRFFMQALGLAKEMQACNTIFMGSGALVGANQADRKMICRSLDNQERKNRDPSDRIDAGALIRST